MKPRHDIYSSITAQLVAAIEAGAGEWRMPWHHRGAPVMRPRSAAGRAYSGINRLVFVGFRRSARFRIRDVGDLSAVEVARCPGPQR